MGFVVFVGGGKCFLRFAFRAEASRFFKSFILPVQFIILRLVRPITFEVPLCRICSSRVVILRSTFFNSSRIAYCFSVMVSNFPDNPVMSKILLAVKKFRIFAAALRLLIVLYLLCCPVCSRRSKMFVIISARVGGSVLSVSSFSHVCSFVKGLKR